MLPMPEASEDLACHTADRLSLAWQLEALFLNLTATSQMHVMQAGLLCCAVTDPDARGQLLPRPTSQSGPSTY